VGLKIAVIDYGVGNVRSIANAFENAGVSIVLTRDKDVIFGSDGVVLPGVGAFSHGMSNLNKYSLVKIIQDYADLNKPLLGICLGMQMFLEESDEFGISQGLGLIEGRVIKLSVENTICEKLPHVSWNEVEIGNCSWDKTIFDGIEDKTDMYFVHSYVAVPANKDDVLSTTIYSDHKFCSSIKKGNIYGCQFHPEKSAKDGLKVINNFINICKESCDA
jgi:imidazole glycerol-phosphate synthase subunit HisH